MWLDGQRDPDVHFHYLRHWTVELMRRRPLEQGVGERRRIGSGDHGAPDGTDVAISTGDRPNGR